MQILVYVFILNVDSFGLDHVIVKRQLPFGSSNMTTNMTDPLIIIGAVAAVVAVGAVAAVATGAVPGIAALGAVPPPAVAPAAVPPGSAPPGVPQPGTLGGGILPTGTSPFVLAGLALVPAGLTAVAVFPPTPGQQIPSLSVIFSESGRYVLKDST